MVSKEIAFPQLLLMHRGRGPEAETVGGAAVGADAILAKEATVGAAASRPLMPSKVTSNTKSAFGGITGGEPVAP